MPAPDLIAALNHSLEVLGRPVVEPKPSTSAATLACAAALLVVAANRAIPEIYWPKARPGTKPSASYQPPMSGPGAGNPAFRSEEHTSELQSLMRTSYAVFC